MTLKDIPPAQSASGELDQMELTPRHQRTLAAAMGSAGGDGAWKARKQVEAEELLLLCQRTSRLEVRQLDLRQRLRVILAMKVPVPCGPTADGDVTIEDHALVAITYPREALFTRLPGLGPVQVLEPHPVFHPNVGTVGQPLCLGDFLPVGIPLIEIVHLTYGGLSMQTVTLDERDPAGIANLEATRWWQNAMHRIPLTRSPLLDRIRAPQEPSS